MGFWDFATFATGVGCLTGVIMVVLNSTLGARTKQQAVELRSALERADCQERRIADLTRQNEQLQQQIEWHVRLVESYERVLGQPAARNGDDRSLAARARDRN